MPIPSHHNPGDAGHAADHNAIVDTLTSQAGAISTLQSTTVGLFYVAGGNVTNIADGTTTFSRINLPTGDRSSAADTVQYYHGSNKISWFDGYGRFRTKTDDPTHVPSVIDSASGQTANLGEWRVNGVLKANVDANGNLAATNVGWGAWTALTLASGYKRNPDFGNAIQYRISKAGDEVQLRGNIVKTSGADFSSSPSQIATLPAGLPAPPSHVYKVCAAQFSGTEHSIRAEVHADKTLWIYYGYTPNWISIDGLSYSPLS
jgi:hypothetical protein